MKKFAIPLVIALFSSFTQASLLYSNEFSPSSNTSHSTGYLSFIRTDPVYGDTTSQVADDFELVSGAQISGFSWFGYYYGGNFYQSDFKLSIFGNTLSNSANLPDQNALYEITISDLLGVGTGYSNGNELVRFSYNLTDILELDAGTYWFSVQGLFEGRRAIPGAFVWNHGAPPDQRNDYVVFSEESEWKSSDRLDRNNQAFSIMGNPLPVPSSIALVCFGLAVSFRFRSSIGIPVAT